MLAQAKELKLDRKVDLRRRLAAAASEAHQEIETIALRRRLLHGDTPSSRGRVTGVGVGAANAPGDSFPEDDKRGRDDLPANRGPRTTSADGTGHPTASALSLARWNQHQKQEQEMRLQQLIVAMRDAVSRGGDESGRRPTLRRGSSSAGSRSTSSGTNSSARGSISGSGMSNNSDALPRLFFAKPTRRGLFVVYNGTGCRCLRAIVRPPGYAKAQCQPPFQPATRLDLGWPKLPV